MRNQSRLVPVFFVLVTTLFFIVLRYVFPHYPWDSMEVYKKVGIFDLATHQVSRHTLKLPDELESGLSEEDKLNPVPKLSQRGSYIVPKLPGRNVISMSLYSSNLKYIIGAIRNAQMVKENFPGWKLVFYMEKQSANQVYGKIPEPVIESLTALGADISYMEVSL